MDFFYYDILGMAPSKFRRDAWPLSYFEFLRIDWRSSLFEAVSIFVSLLCKKNKTNKQTKKLAHDLQITTKNDGNLVCSIASVAAKKNYSARHDILPSLVS